MLGMGNVQYYNIGILYPAVGPLIFPYCKRPKSGHFSTTQQIEIIINKLHATAFPCLTTVVVSQLHYPLCSRYMHHRAI